MSIRTAKVGVSFMFDKWFTEEIMGEMSDNEFIDYCLDTFHDDIRDLVKYGDLSSAVWVETSHETLDKHEQLALDFD